MPARPRLYCIIDYANSMVSYLSLSSFCSHFQMFFSLLSYSLSLFLSLCVQIPLSKTL